MLTRSQSTKFMDLPKEMLAEIFQYNEQETRLQIRFTCKVLKSLIDSHIGISAIIEECTEDLCTTSNKKGRKSKSSLRCAFQQTMCIRQAHIKQLTNTNFFHYPVSLREVDFARGISKSVICSTLKKCRHLTDIVIMPIDQQRIDCSDIHGESFYLSRLRSCRLLCPKTGDFDENNSNSLIAENYLTLLRQIRAPMLFAIQLQSWVTPSCSHMLTIETLVLFLNYHCESLKMVCINLSYLLDENPNEIHHQRQIDDYVKSTVDPLFSNRKLSQKSIAFVNMKPMECTALYPYLKAQRHLEKLMINNNNSATLGLDWNLFRPIFQHNVNIQYLNLTIECRNPFDFSLLKNLTVLKQLNLLVNQNTIDAPIVNGINLHKVPQDLDTLILVNFTLRIEEIEQLPMILKKVQVLGLAQIWGWPPGIHTGIEMSTLRSLIRIRTIESILIHGVMIQAPVETTELMTITGALTGRSELLLITEFEPDTTRYWSLERHENQVTGSLKFYLGF